MNLINIFARGNQELFHSAFLAWLMDKRAQHGLGSQFLKGLLSRCGMTTLYDPEADYEVLTENSEGRLRFDILLRPRQSDAQKKGIVFENKVKSFGQHLQLQNYSDLGYEVVALALLPETLDEDSRRKFPVVEYSHIRSILQGLPLVKENRYHFFVKEYLSYLTNTLETYDTLREYCKGDISFGVFRDRLSRAMADTVMRENDVRTFNFFYYENLRHYLEEKAPDLVFGNSDYKEAQDTNSNTRWISEKNMQGPPFMEAIIHAPFGPARFRMNKDFKALYCKKHFEIAPRIEMWLDLKRFAHAKDDSGEAGEIMLGFWQADVIKMLRERKPYKDRLNYLNNRRNLHVEDISLRDICFSSLADRLRGMLQIVGHFEKQAA
jgi:PD-(D/E)XK nuclease superfamily protein